MTYLSFESSSHRISLVSFFPVYLFGSLINETSKLVSFVVLVIN